MLALILLIAGIGVVLWSAERLTDGVLGAATAFALSGFFVGALVSGFEPENLVTGLVANYEGLPQVALGTVIGSGLFMLLGGLGAALLIVPMKVEIPRAAILLMLASVLFFALALWNDGNIDRLEGCLLLLACCGLMFRLWRLSTELRVSPVEAGEAVHAETLSRSRAFLLIASGTVGTIVGAELIVAGANGVIHNFGFSETFVGMVVVGFGESLEETARMVAPARRGRYDVALGNVVGTAIVLLTFNSGLIAILRPVAADPWVLTFHLPFLAACVIGVGVFLLVLKRLGRWFGGLLIVLYLVYLAVNLRHL